MQRTHKLGTTLILKLEANRQTDFTTILITMYMYYHIKAEYMD
uniref:Uncharacterized protein n=1 Tax=Phragmatopoma lapidosa TaxID=341668 RepID=Q3S4A6_9ANNE|nr:hypothetical protein [Phragmatopoma lapidosa]